MKLLRTILIAIFVVAGLAYLNLIIPQPQTTQAMVTNHNHTDSCGFNYITVNMQGDACASSYAVGNNYNTGATITNSFNKPIQVTVHWDEFLCTSASEVQPNGNCLSNKHQVQQTITIPANSTSPVVATGLLSPSSFGFNNFHDCGLFQSDIWYSYPSPNGGSSCTSTFTGPGTGFGYAGDGWCHLWDGVHWPQWECHAPTPTPVPPTPTPVPPTPTPVQHHDVCQNMECVQVVGPGTSTCSPDASPSQCSHLACVNQSCMRVPGTGSDSCTTNPDSCTTPHHLACVSNSCQSVSGAGQDSCTTNPDSCTPPTLTVIKVVNNNHGGTKTPADFVLRVNGTQVTTGVANTETPGDYTVSEDTMDGYHQVSISGSCDSSGHVHLDNGDSKTCIIENEDNGSGTCTMPTCNTSISGCSYPFPDTNACSCGPLVCITNTPSQNVTVNVNQSQTQNQQQQQQQAVLGASVAPAASPSQLPSTGAGAEVLLSLFGLLPIGFKLRRFV